MFTFVSLVWSTVLFVTVFDSSVLHSPILLGIFFLSYLICGLLNCTDMRRVVSSLCTHQGTS